MIDILCLLYFLFATMTSYEWLLPPSLFVALMRTKHSNELSIQRDETARLELRLAEERRERKQVEESLTHLHTDHSSKIRDLEGKLKTFIFLSVLKNAFFCGIYALYVYVCVCMCIYMCRCGCVSLTIIFNRIFFVSFFFSCSAIRCSRNSTTRSCTQSTYGYRGRISREDTRNRAQKFGRNGRSACRDGTAQAQVRRNTAGSWQFQA